MDNSGSKIVFDEKLNIEVLTLTGRKLTSVFS